MAKRKKKYRPGMYLMERWEEHQTATIYEYMRNCDVKAKLRQGWKIVSRG